MKKLAVFIAIACAACSGKAPDAPLAGPGSEPAAVDAAHNSRNAVDWPGTYTGTLPCADCAGIRTTIRLGADGGFERELVYVGKSDMPVRDAGSFAWNDAGSIVTLETASGEAQQYQVGENRLFHLDRDGSRVAGDLADRYVLDKAARDPRIEDRRWVLVEVMGQAVIPSGERREAFIELDGESGRLGGNGSCNGFFGTYVLEAGQRIRFGDIGATMMACADMTVEDALLEALGRVDNYSIDGDRLSLNRARMAPLLTFEAAASAD